MRWVCVLLVFCLMQIVLFAQDGDKLVRRLDCTEF
jgi:hypothetical protein